MEQVKSWGDERQLYYCVCCGGAPDSNDHIPPKVLLDEPYPENLHVVPACRECNQGASLDEEYLACAIECALSGSALPSNAGRPKVQRILQQRSALAAQLGSQLKVSIGQIELVPEPERVKRVISKLAAGHAAYELNEPQLVNDVSSLWFAPLSAMSQKDKAQFERVETPLVFPEVGSRAMQRLVVTGSAAHGGWITVQAGRYRYSTFWGGPVVVRIVLSEYLAAEVRWGF